MDYHTNISTKQNDVKVWCFFIRTFHWILVISFIIAFASEDDYMLIHSYAGYLITLLLLMRFLWGILGNNYARFRHFTYSPSTIINFVKDTFQLKAKRYLGHNPAGGLMVILLLFSLVLCVLTGMAVYAVEDNAGPMANWLIINSYFWHEALEEIHEFLANFIVILVIIHIIGVIVESMINRENLVLSMFTGYKKREKEQ